ncbi:MAG: cyclic nucleotide-binding domain-containing protein [Dehalococcoidia bacterium]|nr:cyclic nucleotide-binding domain-containing protein [Dehalococcoidia bacterium]
MVTVQDLKQFNLFVGLEESELAEVARLCTRRTYESGAEVFSPGAPAGDVFLLEGGNDAVQIEISICEHSPRTVLHTLQKGEFFGWAALVPPHQRTATARCVGRASVICVDGKALMELLEKNKHMGYVVMKNLSGILSTRLTYTTLVLRREIRKVASKLVTAS